MRLAYERVTRAYTLERNLIKYIYIYKNSYGKYICICKKKLYINMYTYKNRILNTIKYRYVYKCIYKYKYINNVYIYIKM